MEDNNCSFMVYPDIMIFNEEYLSNEEGRLESRARIQVRDAEESVIKSEDPEDFAAGVVDDLRLDEATLDISNATRVRGAPDSRDCPSLRIPFTGNGQFLEYIPEQGVPERRAHIDDDEGVVFVHFLNRHHNYDGDDADKANEEETAIREIAAEGEELVKQQLQQFYDDLKEKTIRWFEQRQRNLQ